MSRALLQPVHGILFPVLLLSALVAGCASSHRAPPSQPPLPRHLWLCGALEWGQGWAAVGRGLAGPTVFVRAEDGREPVVSLVDPSFQGELVVTATPDKGRTWLAGGSQPGVEGEPRGALYRSPDQGRTWRKMLLPEDLGEILHLGFTGRHGLAVGNRAYADAGGFVMVTGNGGVTWRVVEGDLPRLPPMADCLVVEALPARPGASVAAAED